MAVEQLAEIIFFKHAEKVEHVGRRKVERGEIGKLRPPDLAPSEERSVPVNCSVR